MQWELGGTVEQPAAVISNTENPMQCSGTESSVDDLRTSRGVVRGRAATTLRSTETLPLTGGFVLAKKERIYINWKNSGLNITRTTRRKTIATTKINLIFHNKNHISSHK